MSAVVREGGYAAHFATRDGFDEAVARVREALEEEGFGVLTEIDVEGTLREKTGAEFPRFVILGACNPDFAERALRADADVSLLLPCNVTVRETEDGVDASAVRPTVLLGRLARTAGLDDLAEDAENRILRALAKATSRG